MPRPPKVRFIGHEPGARYFKPQGIPRRELDEVVLHRDELEAMRLVDFEGLAFDAAGERMGVSRGTVGRLVETGRQILVDAVLHGLALRVEDAGPHEPSGERVTCCGCRGRRLDGCPRSASAGVNPADGNE